MSELIWKDRKRPIFGLPLSFTIYTLTDETSNAYNIANETYIQAISNLLPKKKYQKLKVY